MKRYRGSEIVEPGIYFNVGQVSFKSVAEEGPLPGSEWDEYRRVPAVALLIAGPLLGGLYAIFLPFIGFAMLAWVASGKLVEVTADAAEGTARVLKPAWQPAMAFFSRRKSTKKARERKDRWAEDVEKELERKEETDA